MREELALTRSLDDALGPVISQEQVSVAHSVQHELNQHPEAETALRTCAGGGVVSGECSVTMRRRVREERDHERRMLGITTRTGLAVVRECAVVDGGRSPRPGRGVLVILPRRAE